MIEHLTVIVGVILILALTRWSRRMPRRVYFSLADLVGGNVGTVTTAAMAVRIFVPAFVGLLLGVLIPSNHPFVGFTAGILAACVLVGPAFLYAEILPPWVVERRAALYFVYLVFIMAYGSVGLVGAQLGIYASGPIRQFFETRTVRSLVTAVLYSAGGPLGAVVANVIATVVVTRSRGRTGWL